MKSPFNAAIAGILALASAHAAPAADEAAVKSAAAGNSAFAVDLYQQLNKSRGDVNAFFSPYSVSSALAMTAQGARGRTAEQMTRTLHLGELAGYQAGIAGINEQLNPPGDVKLAYELSVANALWAEQTFPLNADFVASSGKFFGTPGVFPVDFVRNAEPARLRINSWVEGQTREKIKDLIPRGVVDSRTALVLTNAIYFKGTWTLQFDKRATSDQPFHVAPGKDVTVPLMRSDRESRFAYMETEDFQAISMGYKTQATPPAAAGGVPARGRGAAAPATPGLSMLVILPKKVGGLAAVEQQVTTENLTKWTSALRRQPVQVFLPRFTMTTSFELSKELQALGMTDAFSSTADFSGISSSAQGRLSISSVIHKAFVDVNEEGTEAAAATAVVIRATSVMIDRPIEFRADHPFLFMIRHEPTNSILFMGRVVNPKE